MIDKDELFSIIFIGIQIVYNCFAYDSDKIYFSSFLNVTSFRTFSHVSLSRCIYECKARLRCEAIDYSTTSKRCALINDTSTTSIEERRKGFVGGRKAEWDMVNMD